MTTRSHSRKNTTVYEVRSLNKAEQQYLVYNIGQQLGKGGFANVYEITKHNEKQTNAVKVISKMDRNGRFDPMVLEKVKTEVNVMKAAALNNEGIVQYRHHFGDGSATYIIMEYCLLGDLSNMMKKRKTLTEPEVRFFLAQMVPILIKLKEANIIHRDIKPANYFLCKDFTLKLGDFGLATFNDEQFRKKRSICGTPNYLAPEVIEKKVYSFQVDLWATGIIMYTMLMGIPPFEAKTCDDTYRNIKRCQYRFKSHIHISEDAKNLIGQMLRYDPKKRIDLHKIMKHPFMSHYQIPERMSPEWISTAPPSYLIKKYSKKINMKKEGPDELLSEQFQYINGSRTRLERSKPIVAQKSASITKKSQSAQKEEKVLKPIYRNCQRRLTTVQNDLIKPPPTLNVVKIEEEVVKKELGNTQSKLETSTSAKKRLHFPAQNEEKPQKKFKYNIQPIEEQTIKKEEQLNRTGFKIPFYQEPSPLFSTYNFFEDDEFCKLLLQVFKDKIYQPSQLVTLYSNSYKLSDFATEHKKSNLKPDKKIVWHELTKQNNLVYRLSSNQWGVLFNDGSSILRTSPHKIKYISSTGKTEEGNIYQQNKYLQKLAVLTQCRLRVGNQDKKNSHPHHAIGDVYVESYVKMDSVLMLRYNSGNLHFIISERVELLFNFTDQRVSYQNNGNIQIFEIPLKQTEGQGSAFMQRYMKALSVFNASSNWHENSERFSTRPGFKLPVQNHLRRQDMVPTGMAELPCAVYGRKST